MKSLPVLWGNHVSPDTTTSIVARCRCRRFQARDRRPGSHLQPTAQRDNPIQERYLCLRTKEERQLKYWYTMGKDIGSV